MAARKLSRGWQISIVVVCVLALPGGALLLSKAPRLAKPDTNSEFSSQSRGPIGIFRPTDAQWAALTVEPVEFHQFRLEFETEGKIAVNDDSSTPIFSPYAGRVIKLLSKPGDYVKRGQPLFIVEATDTVQGLNDFVAALSATNTAHAKLNLAQIVEKRAKDLYAGKAVPLKDWQQAQADLAAAQNDMRSSETAVEAVRNRLHILGRSDEEIAAFQEKRQIKPDTPIYSPIEGTVVQRKIGPGQYINSGATDPAFVIGDLSTVWLAAFVRETDVANVSAGQDIAFTVMAAPGRSFRARLNYVASAFDPASRRLLVRATIENSDGVLKPEMFANVRLFSNGNSPDGDAPAVPRSAVIYEGEAARLWIAHDDHSIELREIKIGLSDATLVQVLSGVLVGEKVVTKGTLFIDRTASDS
ncbi:MAG: efflux RND transporter periplasmic adaptor subunit [Pseudomonadota bacterium]|nr:efflux RND transporter periplasmic adaptor subunit [Pseudomonadota bacterium]